MKKPEKRALRSDRIIRKKKHLLQRETALADISVKKFKDKDLIKVITGIRRCGKSTILEIFRKYLIETGIEEEQIISINLEDLRYNFIKDYMDLYNYINDMLKEDKKNYVFIDEIQIIPLSKSSR